MGQQQLLLVVLGVIIVGMAVYGSARIMNNYSAENSRDRVRQEGLLLVQYADEYKLRAKQLGGGGGKYDGFVLPNFFVDEPDIGYWVSGSGQYLQVYSCGWGADAPKGENGRTPVAVLITKNGSEPIRVTTLN